MGFDRVLDATLSFPMVQRQQNEALSSWLARIAKEHLLDLEHVEAEIGCPLSLVDHDPSGGIVDRIARRTGTDAELVRAGVHPIAPLFPPRRGELDWRVCPQCLRGDRDVGRPPYVRVVWIHPLVTICLEHMVPLVIPSAEEWSELAGDGARPSRQDVLLNQIDAEPLDAFIRAARLVLTEIGNAEDVRQLEREVADIAEALAVQMTRSMGQGAVLSLFEQPRRGRHVRAFALDLQHGLLSHMTPADRLLFVRAALALRWPTEGFVQERAVLGDWYSVVVRISVPSSRRRMVGDHGLDPLSLLALALPANAFHQLRQRSTAWSPDLRRRWAVAEQLAGLAGLT